MADKPKAKRKPKTEPKVEAMTPVTQLSIPARYIWGESPLKIAAQLDAPQRLKKLAIDTHLDATVIGDFVAIRNEDCEETFIFHKDVLKEILEAAD